MAWWRVWLHGNKTVVGSQDIEAGSAQDAAEESHGGPLDLIGPIGALRATVIATDELTTKTQSFFKPLGTTTGSV